MVTLTHPKLPDREITVHDDAVAHYKRAGWRPKRAAKVTEAGSGPDEAETRRTRRRRTADKTPADTTKEN